MTVITNNLPNLIWVHEDALSLDHPVFKAAGEGASAVFIWDEFDLKQRGHSLNKLVFIYECLQNMGVTLYKGKTSERVGGLLSSHAALYMAKTYNPELKALIAPLENQTHIIEVEATRLSDIEVTPDMARFFRFWNKAKRSIMKVTADE